MSQVPEHPQCSVPWALVRLPLHLEAFLRFSASRLISTTTAPLVFCVCVQRLEDDLGILFLSFLFLSLYFCFSESGSLLLFATHKIELDDSSVGTLLAPSHCHMCEGSKLWWTGLCSKYLEPLSQLPGPTSGFPTPGFPTLGLISHFLHSSLRYFTQPFILVPMAGSKLNVSWENEKQNSVRKKKTTFAKEKKSYYW